MGVMDRFFLDKNNAVLVVIDIQERLCAAMDQEVLERLTRNTSTLLDAAKELGIPVVATEQYVKGLGCTLPALREKIDGSAYEKMTFSCCGDPAFINRIAELDRKQIIVTGMETHVCVLQTVLELLERDYRVHLVKDAVMSRAKENWELGLITCQAAGAVITSTEAALFQLLRVAGTDEFKKLSKLVR